MISGIKAVGKNAIIKNMNQNQGKLFVGITLVEQLAHVGTCWHCYYSNDIDVLRNI
jgi:hypothetical protein